MRAISAKQRFPVAQWKRDLETLQATSMKLHAKIGARKSGRYQILNHVMARLTKKRNNTTPTAEASSFSEVQKDDRLENEKPTIFSTPTRIRRLSTYG